MRIQKSESRSQKLENLKVQRNMKLSCTLAVFNEEENIGRCLESVKDLVDEIVVVDGGSTDGTVKVAKKYGANVVKSDNPKVFHINKNKANDLAKGEWILQLDADEIVSKELANEIRQLLRSQESGVRSQKLPDLYARHQRLVEERDGKIGSANMSDPVVAFFIPRRNYFLGKFLRFGGAYPDGVIRLFKKGKARFTEKSVHDQYVVDGQVGWLQNDLWHYDSPTLERYLKRNDRYAELFADELARKRVPLNLFNSIYYLLIKPLSIFLQIFVRHKGLLDGYYGLLWAWYSGSTWRKAWRNYVNYNS